MNRLAAIQKSSRTITIAWTCSPSQWRRAATSSVFSSPRLGVQPLLELVQDEQHLPLRWQDATPSQLRQRIDQPQSSGKFGTRLA